MENFLDWETPRRHHLRGTNKMGLLSLTGFERDGEEGPGRGKVDLFFSLARFYFLEFFLNSLFGVDAGEKGELA